MLRRQADPGFGAFDPQLPHAGDWDMWLRATARFDVAYIARPSYAYRIHGQNMSHSRIPPSQATDELLLTVKRAFAALPDDAPPAIRALQRDAVRRALMQAAWIDVYEGRLKRSWLGVLHALRRCPGIVVDRSFWGLVARLGKVTATCKGRGPGANLGDAAESLATVAG
jgi:hypothetical protein